MLRCGQGEGRFSRQNETRNTHDSTDVPKLKSDGEKMVALAERFPCDDVVSEAKI